MFLSCLSGGCIQQVDGTKEQPIEIKGPSSGATAIIKGSDKSGTCVEINHDYYILNVSAFAALSFALSSSSQISTRVPPGAQQTAAF